MKFIVNRSSDFLIALAEGLSKIATFFIIPVSGLFLLTADFNQWSIIFPSIQTLSSALSFGLPNYLLTSYYNKKGIEFPNNSPIYISFLFILVISILCFLVIKSVYPENPFLRWDIYWILLTNSFLLIIQQKYQAEKDGLKYFYQSLFWRIGFALVLGVLFVFKLNTGIDFLLTALLIVQLILLAVAIYQECHSFNFNLLWTEQKDILIFGFPLFLTGVLQFVIYMNSRYFVYSQGNTNETAIFSLIHTFVGTLNLLFVIFVRIYVPKLFEVLNGTKKENTLFLYKKAMFGLFEVIAIVIFITLFCYSSLYKTGFEMEIFKITPILILGQFFYSMQIFIIDSLLYYKKTFKMFLISLVSATFSVCIGYLLVQRYGIQGAAVGVCLTQFLALAIVIFFTKDLFQKILGLRYCLTSLFRIVTLMITGYACYHFLGKIPVITFFIIAMGYFTWRLNIPELIKKFI